MIFDVELHCDKWMDCKPITPKKKKVEKVLSNSDMVYILYADGTWMKKEKK